MYSDKLNVNILTSLMSAHGVKTVVVCPGSRNAPLAHNFSSCPKMRCVSVTDERSAGFYAIGLALASQRPVAVCVTSGTALLNLAPAVAEAFYQNVPLLVISADRPLAMIGQMQGQTLPQTGAFGNMAKYSVSLPEPDNEVEHWHCNRIVNEALAMLTSHGAGPVHINVPVSEPLYNFTIAELPCERKINYVEPKGCNVEVHDIVAAFAKAERPMIVVGQLPRNEFQEVADIMRQLSDKAVVISEKLSDDSSLPLPSPDVMMAKMECSDDYLPDAILYVGGHLLSKPMLGFLQKSKPERCIVVSRSEGISDVLMNATDVVVADVSTVLREVANVCKNIPAGEWLHRWQKLKAECLKNIQSYEPAYSQTAAIKEFFSAIKGKPFDVHVGNSMSVRIAQLFSDRYLFVNRGVSGIEGSLSTAAGYSLMSPVPVACIIGDLSFFYDANALWHSGLCGNFRILLVNNGCGGIFRRFRNLEDSPACDSYVMARHNTTAGGVCMQNGVAYRRVTYAGELADGISWLVDERCPSPMLLEVVTDDEDDQREYENILK